MKASISVAIAGLAWFSTYVSAQPNKDLYELQEEARALRFGAAEGSQDDVARAPQVEGGGAKKHRRLPSGRLQRQNSPSGEGWASLNGTASYIDGPMPASGPWMIT